MDAQEPPAPLITAPQYRALTRMTHKVTQQFVEAGELIDLSVGYQPEDIELYITRGIVEQVFPAPLTLE